MTTYLEVLEILTESDSFGDSDSFGESDRKTGANVDLMIWCMIHFRYIQFWNVQRTEI